MGFMKPKKPKVPKVTAAELPADPLVVEDQTRRGINERERRRQGTATATLTSSSGLAGQPITTATKRLLGA